MIQSFLTRGATCMYYVVILFLSGFTILNAQPEISATECICEANDNERLGELIRVDSGGGETWTITNVSGLFVDQMSNTEVSGTLTESPAGVYTIMGYRNNQSSYSITVRRTAGGSSITRTYTPEIICTYPDFTIYGDEGVCINSIHEYYLNIPEDDIVDLQWNLSPDDGNWLIFGPDDSISLTIEWQVLTGGPYTLSVSGDIPDACDLSNEIPSIDIFVLDEEPIVLACDNWINLSLAADCEVEVTPDMVLEAMAFTILSYDVVLTDLETGITLREPIVDGDDVGKLFLVEIIHECSGNACWGYILVEDKFVPFLECESDTIICDESLDPYDLEIGFPLPEGSMEPEEIGENEYHVMGFDMCGDAFLTFEDSVVVQDCESEFGSIIYRKWKVTDESNRMSMCYDTLYVERTEIMDEESIAWPPNFDVNNPLDCNDRDADPEENDNYWVSLPNGYPAPIDIDEGGTGYPDFVMCGNIEVTYSDTKYEKCGAAAFKIRRRWTVLDWCTREIRFHNQLISVLDDEPPVCVAPQDDLIGYTVPGECLTSFKVPPLVEIIDCSETTVMVGYKPKRDDLELGDFSTFETAGVTGPDANGYFTIPKIQTFTDSVWIAYKVTDECGNTCEAFTEVKIIDKEEPTAVCDEHTTVGLNDSGMAWANVYAIDDGSHDNCGVEELAVRRMGYLDQYGKIVTQNESCGEVHNWAQTMKFCCEDVGKTLLVELRVTDGNGNTNVCMAEVTVQDKTPPILISCPPDKTIICTDAYDDLSKFGFPVFEDNCSLESEKEEIFLINECKVGKIIRKFYGVDKFGNKTKCVQTITVDPPNVIKRSDFYLPLDYKPTNGCMGQDIHPDNLPAPYSWPQIKEYVNRKCTSIEISYEDLVFYNIEEACLKVIRTWTIIDWCRFKYDGQGVIYHTQLIIINNSTPPSITSELSVLGALSDCKYNVELRGYGVDDCPNAKLIWKVEVDFHNDGSVDIFKTVPNVDGVYPGGTHKVTWRATDECGNTGVEVEYIVLDDNKEPTPVCISELVTVIMEETESVTIWASDFTSFKKSSDNCDDDLESSFSGTDINEQFYTIYCEDLEGEMQKHFELEVWMWDDNDNRDFCMVYLLVQDNSNVCGNEPIAEEDEEEEVEQKGSAMVSGSIYNESYYMVSDVKVKLDADLAEYPYYQSTKDDGHYAFESLPMKYEYKVLPSKYDNPLNGISTMDLLLIQRHIMGIKSLDSPYKIIAADANQSRSITASDLIVLRRLILGQIDKLPGDVSWRFVDAGFTFADPQQPFPFREHIKIYNLEKDLMHSNFVAVKIGDVNGSVKANRLDQNIENRYKEKITLFVEDIPLQPGSIVEIPFELDEPGDVHGFQFALSFDRDKLEFSGIKPGIFSLGPEHIHRSDGNVIAVSWQQQEPVSLRPMQDLFSLIFKVKAATNPARSISLAGEWLAPEVYTSVEKELIENQLELNFRSPDPGSQIAIEHEFSLHQNIPNPFSEKTTVNFTLPQEGPYTFHVFDLSGKQVVKLNGTGQKGTNRIELEIRDLRGIGIYYYQMQTDYATATKKMIVIK